MDRRKFIQMAALGGAAMASSNGQTPTEGNGLRVGVIGCGWYGKNDVFRLIQVAPVEVLALCDVDSRMLDEAAGLVAARQVSRKVPQKFRDYREMLAARNLDLVIVGTPDHWHALPAIAALEAGANVYLQKPISVDVIEGEAILAAARKAGKAVQVGTQRRSTPHLIDARNRIIGEGKLGRVGHAEICSYYHMRQKGNPPDSAPPAHLDWEMWTGPAPLRPYHEGIHPGAWRSYKEYGNGFVGDMCIHMLDTVRWLLGLGWPVAIGSSGGILIDKASRANVPDTQTATFAFPEMTVTWQHRTWGNPPDPAYPWALVLYGDKGTLKASVDRWEFIPTGKKEAELAGEAVIEEGRFPEERDEKRFEAKAAAATRQHFQNLLGCIAKGGRPVADIEEGHISTASCILANMALETGRVLRYDPVTRTVPGDAEATALLRRPYRAPWRHPEV
jgi:predicted dehydrogenase